MVPDRSQHRESDAPASDCPSRTYYFEIGPGRWRGTFDFRVTDWRAFLGASVGVVNRLLVAALAFAMRLFGAATITSTVEAHPERGEAGVATNEIRVTKFGLAFYTLREEYRLDGNCRDVAVVVDERFGPVPGLLQNHKDHPATVVPGPRANYRVPLLGADWTGRVEPSADGERLDGEFTCEWATVSESLNRVG